MISLKKHFPHVSTLYKTVLAIAALGLMIPGWGSVRSGAEATPLPPSTPPVFAEGTYLFGQSAQPNEIGSAYTVFTVQNTQVVGAFYQPRSSFDCFSGQVQSGQLALNITDSYSQETYPYNVALTLDTTLVAGGGAPAYRLEGFHRIDTLSEVDREILTICAAQMAQ